MAEEALPAVRSAPRSVAPRSARRRSREFALQGLYQWQLAGAGVNEIKQHLATVKGFERADEAYFRASLNMRRVWKLRCNRILTANLSS